MNKRLQSYMTQIFLVWLTLFVVLAVMTVQSMEWERARPAPTPTLPVAVSEPAPLPVPEPEPEPALPSLLPVGKKQGKGRFGKPEVAWMSESREFSVTIPYTGTLGEYTRFPFNAPAHAECFDLHGLWQIPEGNFPVPDKTCPIFLVQAGQHGSFVRFSLVGDAGQPEVRYTESELVLVLKDVKPRTRTTASRTRPATGPQKAAPLPATGQAAGRAASQNAGPAPKKASPAPAKNAGSAPPARP